jgi:hypothetical protein
LRLRFWRRKEMGFYTDTGWVMKTSYNNVFSADQITSDKIVHLLNQFLNVHTRGQDGIGWSAQGIDPATAKVVQFELFAVGFMKESESMLSACYRTSRNFGQLQLWPCQKLGRPEHPCQGKSLLLDDLLYTHCKTSLWLSEVQPLCPSLGTLTFYASSNFILVHNALWTPVFHSSITYSFNENIWKIWATRARVFTCRSIIGEALIIPVGPRTDL